jgi:hypothetical protein
MLTREHARIILEQTDLTWHQNVPREAVDALKGIAYGNQKVAGQDGCVRVPREPTEAMSVAGISELHKKHGDYYSRSRAVYKAMLSASPAAQESSDVQVQETNNSSSPDASEQPAPSGDQSSFLDEARMIAAQCWCDKETSSITMDTRLAEAFARRLATWMDTGAQHARNETYWRQQFKDQKAAVFPEHRYGEFHAERDAPAAPELPEEVQNEIARVTSALIDSHDELSTRRLLHICNDFDRIARLALRLGKEQR